MATCPAYEAMVRLAYAEPSVRTARATSARAAPLRRVTPSVPHAPGRPAAVRNRHGHGGDSRPITTAPSGNPRCCGAPASRGVPNGASGIAVGMATEIPSHNLREVSAATAAHWCEPDTGDDALLACIRGPDFPGGGQIISLPREIRDAYLSGRGSLKTARALDGRGVGTWPVAGGRQRTAARRIDAQSAGRDRRTDQSQGQNQQEKPDAGPAADEAAYPVGAGRGGGRVGQVEAMARVPAQVFAPVAGRTDERAARARPARSWSC